MVRAARHAVAIDERRRTFPPTLWDNLDGAERRRRRQAPYAQRWFPGDHGAVGGGRAVTALSDDALVWVAEGAAAAGLALDPAAVAAWRRRRDCLGPLRARAAAVRRLLTLDCRDRLGPGRLAEVAEAAVRRWRADPRYRPRALARVAAALERGEPLVATLGQGPEPAPGDACVAPARRLQRVRAEADGGPAGPDAGVGARVPWWTRLRGRPWEGSRAPISPTVEIG